MAQSFKIWKNAILAGKTETTEGVYNAPAGTDAIKIANPKISYVTNNVTTNEDTGSLDNSPPIVGGQRGQLTFDVYLKGNGAPGTTAPEWGKLLKACGFTETLTGAAVGTPTAITAGTANSVTLGAPFSGANEAYRGMPINLSGTIPSGWGNGTTGASIIRDFNSTSKLALLTDTASAAFTVSALAQIPANALYTLGSASIPSLSMDLYAGGLKFSFVGGRGTVKFQAKSGGALMASFTFNLMFNGETDSAPVTPTYDGTTKPIWKNSGGNVGGGANFSFDGVAAALSNFTLDIGNTLVNPDDPNANESFDAAQITQRDVTGTIDPYQTSIATRDIMADFRSMTARCIAMRMGGSSGNSLALTVFQGQYTKADPKDTNALMSRDVAFDALGNDASVMALACW